MEAWFDAISSVAAAAAKGTELVLLWVVAERSDFVRFNRGRLRQAGSVAQRHVGVRLIDGGRQSSVSLELEGSRADGDRIRAAVDELRDVVAQLPQDPHLLVCTDPVSTRDIRRGEIPDATDLAARVAQAADGLDLVGFLASGVQCRGFANSLGQRNWHAIETFNLDWSVYLRADKAVKAQYAGFAWSDAEFARRLAATRIDAERMTLPAERIEPGEYRTYLAPHAMHELMGLLAWGGFSARARAMQWSPLQKLGAGERWSTQVTLAERLRDGTAPRFQADGFVRPDEVTLVDRGAFCQALVAPRTAREYGLAANGANGRESPESLVMAAGTLADESMLDAIDDGLHVGNLWYLNYSDRMSGRITGMTRFATFRVRRGRITGPVEVMRFDDTLYRMLGTRLAGLTARRERILDTSTYSERSTDSALLPGALIDGLRFTL